MIKEVFRGLRRAEFARRAVAHDGDPSMQQYLRFFVIGLI